MIASDDAFHLGVLSSRVHLAWASPDGTGGLLEDRPVYVKSDCFEKFPFPVCSATLQERIRAEAETLDAHRKRQMELFPKLTLTDIYNVLEALREGRPLTDRERVTHEHALVSVLREIHDELDALVFEAYDWNSESTDDDLRALLVDLNRSRAQEESEGLVRWVRPDLQRSATQRGLRIRQEPPATKQKITARPIWPRDLASQVVAVRNLLDDSSLPMTTREVARRFKQARKHEIERALDSLAALGLVVRHADDPMNDVWQSAAPAGTGAAASAP